MPQVGIRELKNDASEIIRAVREERAEYVVTLRGRPVAVILPVAEGWQEAETERRPPRPAPMPISGIGWRRCVEKSPPNGRAIRPASSWSRSSDGEPG